MTSNAVVTPHFASASAARKVLERGGNAVDAAVAAIAAQGVVAPETCGLGGDLFALVHAPGWEQPLTLNASGRAGAQASAESIRSAGHETIPLEHPAVATIPGCVDGLEALVHRLGTETLADVLEPAIELATDGFDVSTEQARAFAIQADRYRGNPAVASFYPDGSPVVAGDHVTRPHLARTLQAIRDGGRAAFYEGVPGEDIIEATGGMVTRDDLTRSQAEWIEPIAAGVAGLSAWTIPPNSQGYLGPAALAVFEMLDPPDDPESPLWWHLLIEAYRSLAWERDDLVADPANVPLPAHLLLEPARLERAASSIRRDQTGSWPDGLGVTSGTAYLCVADAHGLAVSLIQSNYRGTGSAFGARRSGFLLHDRGSGFSLMPGHPNELGPGKRPLHTLSPTLWTAGEQPRWIVGTRGGTVQPQLIAQVAARAILGDSDLDLAQAAPRWAISDFGPYSPSHLRAEPGVPAGALTGLAERGHRIETLDEPQPGWGPLSIIELAPKTHRAAADPRVDTTTAYVF